ncbi:hypothetical protein Btru_011120 [Bulinus truncatus]|nr:hypothetical protein Btru_011120 [Bulinus truncatus]
MRGCDNFCGQYVVQYVKVDTPSHLRSSPASSPESPLRLRLTPELASLTTIAPRSRMTWYLRSGNVREPQKFSSAGRPANNKTTVLKGHRPPPVFYRYETAAEPPASLVVVWPRPLGAGTSSDRFCQTTDQLPLRIWRNYVINTTSPSRRRTRSRGTGSFVTFRGSSQACDKCLVNWMDQ